MSESSSISDVEVSPSTDSLDTLIGLSTETGRTTAVSPSSSSAGPPASSDAALASSDSESRPVTPRQEGGNRTQNGDQTGVGRPAPSSGAHDEPTAAAASAATTGPGLSDPAVDLLVMLHGMQEQQETAAAAAVPTAATATRNVSRANATITPSPTTGGSKAGTRGVGATPRLPPPPRPPLRKSGPGTSPTRWPRRNGA